MLLMCLRGKQRPFVNYYGPTFILYELSSPFLNLHWFFDKLNMTGSRPQLYNGILLLATFFGCRLVWGTYQSIRVYQDVWAALQSPGPALPFTGVTDGVKMGMGAIGGGGGEKNAEIMRFAGDSTVPIWLACTYLGSNTVLNTLNFYWFGKMIEAVKKRFQPPKERRRKSVGVVDGGVHGGVRGGVVANGNVLASDERLRSEHVGNGVAGRRVVAEKKEVRRRKG